MQVQPTTRYDNLKFKTVQLLINSIFNFIGAQGEGKKNL